MCVCAVYVGTVPGTVYAHTNAHCTHTQTQVEPFQHNNTSGHHQCIYSTATAAYMYEYKNIHLQVHSKHKHVYINTCVYTS